MPSISLTESEEAEEVEFSTSLNGLSLSQLLIKLLGLKSCSSAHAQCGLEGKMVHLDGSYA